MKKSYELNFTSGPNEGTPLDVSYIIIPPVKGVVSPDVRKKAYSPFRSLGKWEFRRKYGHITKLKVSTIDSLPIIDKHKKNAFHNSAREIEL